MTCFLVPPRTAFSTFAAPGYLPESEEAVLHNFNQPHNYHISLLFLLSIFEDSNLMRSF